MPELTKAKEPFRFYTRLHLSELTGCKASTIGQLLDLIKKIPPASLYHHTHRFLQQHQYLSPEPPNDFAYWVAEAIGEDELGEELSSIDTVQYSSLEGLRQKIVATIEAYLKDNPLAKLKFTRNEEELHFIKSISFLVPTNYVVYDLKEFVEVLKKITMDSIYFHIFEARLRLEKKTNDFSNWIESSIHDKELARQISNLDPYTRTLENLRESVIEIIEKRIGI